MPLMIMGKTPCAISGKIISKEDKFLCFPQFLCDPLDPAIVCQDACVLRDEFEKWEFRENVIRRVKSFWSLDYRLREAFTVVFEDENYLLVKSKVEDKAEILFFQHIFVIDVPKAKWREFCKEVLSDSDVVRISPYCNTTFIFTREAEGVQICVYTQQRNHDCVKVPYSEWSDFQAMLAANEDLFD